MLETLTKQQILTVSDLNRSVKKLLENHFQTIWIEGEVSNFSRPQSGHVYFSLKDQHAQVRCAMFRLRNKELPFELANGMHILAVGRISLYEGRGDYQLIIEHIEDRGEGILRRRFEILKNQLATEGLFDPTKKQKIPYLPKKIGVITSPTGAAIRDVLSVLKRRFANLPILIYPTAVQGEQAISQIANAIATANKHNDCDVLILCRGGGSLEDLWAFNEEIVARAIYASKIPIVSGVGHEIDFTIADFVADQRAATPSAAAELLSPDQAEFARRCSEFTNRMVQNIKAQILNREMLLSNYRTRFLQPAHLLQKYNQMLDIKEQAIINAMRIKLDQEQRKVQIHAVKLNYQNPIQKLNENKVQLKLKTQLLTHLLMQKLAHAKQSLGAITRTLNTVSPLNTLSRGYSITMKDSHVIDDISQVQLGDALKILLKTGYMLCQVIDKSNS
jgi:exodeoxyribonuclease VII large subunit